MADLPVIRVAQIWASRAESDRQFFVQRVADGLVRGMDYHVRESATRTRKVPVRDFMAEFKLAEDTPAGLLRGVTRG